MASYLPPPDTIWNVLKPGSPSAIQNNYSRDKRIRLGHNSMNTELCYTAEEGQHHLGQNGGELRCEHVCRDRNPCLKLARMVEIAESKKKMQLRSLAVSCKQVGDPGDRIRAGMVR